MKSKFENRKWRWVKPIELIELIRTPFFESGFSENIKLCTVKVSSAVSGVVGRVVTIFIQLMMIEIHLSDVRNGVNRFI